MKEQEQRMGRITMKAGEGSNRADHDFKYRLVLTYFEMEKYCQIQSTFNSIYSRTNLPKLKDVTYLLNLDEYKNHQENIG